MSLSSPPSKPVQSAPPNFGVGFVQLRLRTRVKVPLAEELTPLQEAIVAEQGPSELDQEVQPPSMAVGGVTEATLEDELAEYPSALNATKISSELFDPPQILS